MAEKLGFCKKNLGRKKEFFFRVRT